MCVHPRDEWEHRSFFPLDVLKTKILQKCSHSPNKPPPQTYTHPEAPASGSLREPLVQTGPISHERGGHNAFVSSIQPHPRPFRALDPHTPTPSHVHTILSDPKRTRK